MILACMQLGVLMFVVDICLLDLGEMLRGMSAYWGIVKYNICMYIYIYMYIYNLYIYIFYGMPNSCLMHAYA